jgi:hypothetical protein
LPAIAGRKTTRTDNNEDITMRTGVIHFATAGVFIAGAVVGAPIAASSQDLCLVNPKTAAPTQLSPRAGEVVTLVYVSSGGGTASTDGTISFTAETGTSVGGGGVNFRWSGSFRADERFILEVGVVSVTSRVAPTSTTTSGIVSTRQVSSDAPTRTTTTSLDSQLSSYGTSRYTTAAGAREYTVNLEAGKSYRWRIRAHNCGGDAPFSAFTTFSVASPSSTTATATSTTTITAAERSNPAPAVTSLSPGSIAAGHTSPLVLTVYGSSFATGAVVRWNGADRPTTAVTRTRVTATIPASDLVVPTTVQITVSNPAPGGGISSPLPFQVIQP